MTERPDIELANDKQQGVLRDNYWSQFNIPKPPSPFAENKDGALKVSDIVKQLVAQGGGQRTYWNNQIFWDMELGEAREEAAIAAITPDGWDSPVTEIEQINVDGHGDSHEYEIRVEVYGERD